MWKCDNGLIDLDTSYPVNRGPLFSFFFSFFHFGFGKYGSDIHILINQTTD